METKICKYCKESILADALKCPKCQSFQSRWNPSLLFLIPLIILPALLIPLFNSSQNRTVKF